MPNYPLVEYIFDKKRHMNKISIIMRENKTSGILQNAFLNLFCGFMSGISPFANNISWAFLHFQIDFAYVFSDDA